MGQKLVKKTLKVNGMTCVSCERKIQESLKKTNGIAEANASFTNAKVNIVYDSNVVEMSAIEKVIFDAGYEVKESSEEEKSDKLTLNQLLGIGIILLALYTIINHTIGFNFIPEIEQSMSYGILFVVGLITSLHCIAMCGGINLSQCVSYKANNDSNNQNKIKPSFLYNAGRVVSYTVIGGIVGALGGVISFPGIAKGIVAVIAGVFMVIMGINMLHIFPWLRKLNPRMPRFLGDKIRTKKGNSGPFYVGILNGLMPCGPLQAMQLYALGTGSFIAGATSMLMFSLGTVPLMFGFGAVSTLLSRKFTNRMLKFSAVLVIALGVVMAGRGLSLSGMQTTVIADNNKNKAPVGNIAKMEGNKQVVTIDLLSNKYTPIIVQKGIPVEFNIRADKQNINGCNGTIYISKYKLQRQLKPGDNIIEFTPEEEGNIPFSCWMGMIRSNILVVADLSEISDSTIQEVEESNAAGGFTMPCCQ